MAYKTQKKLREERIKKAYFKYWQLQNHPDYIEWYKKYFTSNEPYLTDENKEQYESIILPQMRQKFKLNYMPVDPFKKIDWLNFKKILLEPDQQILLTFKGSQQVHGPITTFLIRKGIPAISEEMYREMCPFGIIINLSSFDKYEIIEAISQEIDYWRSAKRFHGLAPHRDSFNKFHLYAQVWNLRRGGDRKSFPEIATMMGINISTIKSRFYKAFELIFGRSHTRDFFRESNFRVHKESLANYCSICKERENCVDPCPDVIPFIMQDWRERNREEVQALPKNPKIMAHLGLNN